MKRATAVALAFGLFASFMVLLPTPAGAQTGQRTRALEDFTTAPYYVYKGADTWNASNVTYGAPGAFPGQTTPIMYTYSASARTGSFAVFASASTMTIKTFFYVNNGTADCYWRLTPLTGFEPVAPFDTSATAPFHSMTSSVAGNKGIHTATLPTTPGHGYHLTWSHPNGTASCGITSISNVIHPDDWDYVPQPAPAVPQLACGRTMRYVGDGQWYADVDVLVRNPATPPLEDVYGTWRPSFNAAASFPGQRQTIPLPPGAKIGDGHTAKHTMRRDYPVDTRWSVASEQSGDLVEDTDDYLTPDDVVGGPVVGGPILRAVTMAAEWILNMDDPGGGTITAVDSDGNSLPKLPTIDSDVASVYATCSVNIDPVPVEESGTTNWVVINITNNPADPAAPPADATGCPTNYTYDVELQTCLPGDTGGGGESGCNDSAWYKFWDWPEKLVCLLENILGTLADLLGDLLAWLMERFGDFTLPGVDPSEWTSKFPLSLISEAVGAVDATHDAISGGLSSSCGPTLDPDLDSKITLPGAGSAAQLDTIKASLPSADPACGQSAQVRSFADLGGFRSPLRSFFTVALWAAFIVRAAHSIGPGRSGIEPDSA